MTQNVQGVLLKKSKQKNDNGTPKLPTSDKLVEGELAINYAKGLETISTKNESGNVVTFSSDNYYTEQKLGSGFTGSNSAKTVTEAIEEDEMVWANAFAALSGAVSSHTENATIHVTASDKTNWNGKLDASAIADFFDDAKYEDSGTTKVINFYHGSTIKATIDASDFIVDGMIDDVRIENGYLVIDFNTASGKEDISIPLTDIFDPSNYYNKTAIDSLVGSGFTSSSITDVIIENEEIISAALTDLDDRKLDASAYTPTDLSNYYQKSETSGKTEIATALSGKANTATTIAGYGITDAYTKSETSGATELSTALSNKASQSDLETVSGTVTSHTADTSVHVSQSLLDEIASLKTAIYSENGHLYVEIGGVKWATMNVGASSPTDYGQYFQWGSTVGYTASQVGTSGTTFAKPFKWYDYKFGNGTSDTRASGMTKYNSGDTKTVLDLSDDAAHANWGGSWRMPTAAEYRALGNAVNTAWTANYQGSGVAGLVCTDKTDSSKVLFFPAAGVCGDDYVLDVGSVGRYWSSSLYSNLMQYAYYLVFLSGSTSWGGYDSRYYGFPVRGVVG